MDVNFRKIDIDQFDEDALQDSEVYEQDSRNPADILDGAKQRQISVRGLLNRSRSFCFFFSTPWIVLNTYAQHNRNDITGALTTTLDDAPYGQNVDEAKVLLLSWGSHGLTTAFFAARHATDSPHHPQQHQVDRNI